MADFLILDDDKNLWNNDNITEKNNSGSFMDKLNNMVVWFQSVKTKEKVVFYNLLSTMTNAWITLIKAISILEKQEKNVVFKNILWRFSEELKEWRNLSECLGLYPSSFSDAEVWIIKSWEKTWQLNSVLSDLANQLEKVESLNWKIKWAMMYPFFILIVVIWVVSVMMMMIVPKLLEIFTDKSTLPSSTKVLMFVSDIFRDYWYIMIAVIVVFYVALLVWKKTPDWKYLFDKALLYIPVFWSINKKLVLSKFARTFAWLAWSWVSVVEWLKITSSAVWNEVYKQRILLLAEDISVWIKMWESLDWDKMFPEMMVQMIQVWEQTAKLEQIIIKVADFYDEEVDNTIKILNKLLEPFIIVTLAVVVWFIALAIMQPIMNLADTVVGW